MNSNQKNQLIAKVKKASETWKNAFNSGNAAGCAAQYTATATMHARPFGTFEGTAAIQQFWQNLIDGGFSEVSYIEPELEVINEQSAVLKSRWKMNKAAGVIHKELWMVQTDGHAKLVEDVFEVLESQD